MIGIVFTSSSTITVISPVASGAEIIIAESLVISASTSTFTVTFNSATLKSTEVLAGSYFSSPLKVTLAVFLPTFNAGMTATYSPSTKLAP